MKKYSSTVATIFTGLMSAVLFGHALSINFCIGVTIVLISMHLFFTSAPGGHGAKKSRPGFSVSPSMDHISDKVRIFATCTHTQLYTQTHTHTRALTRTYAQHLQ